MLGEIVLIKCLINITKKLKLSWTNQMLILLYLVTIITKQLVTIIIFETIIIIFIEYCSNT